eukprot:g7561.t1
MRRFGVFLTLLMTVSTAEGQTCSNGLAGFESSSVCCPVGCGDCGGSGCAKFNLDLGKDCCTGHVKDSGVLCSEAKSAPCIIDTATVDPGDDDSVDDTQTCPGNIPGINANDKVCCALSCGTCAGEGCSSRPGGADACCGSGVKAAQGLCSETGEAPCVLDGEAPTPTPPTPTPGTFTCNGVQKNEYCCSDGCGTCGGSDCGNRGGGLTGDDCCQSDILKVGNVCSDTQNAPCVITGDSTSPTPTPPTPTPPAPTSPSPTPTIASTCSGTIATISTSSEVSTFTDGGCATLTDMYNAQSGSGPLFVLDSSDKISDGAPTGRWLLTSSLEILDGVTLYVHGKSAGGDADVLRIESTDDDFYEIRAWGGNLSFKETTVTSWDTEAGGERTKYEGGRSFINCVTQFDDSDKWSCDGRSNKERGECRMDIIDSTMGNLGYFDAESYGLTWKVRGFCKDGSNEEIFEDHNVYGDIQGSEIYGMYYGMYSYGHQGGVWTNNIMRDNILYGFDPHDDSDYLTIADNEVYGNGNHGIIASKRCNNVEIYNNEVYDGDEAGIFLHRSSDNAMVYNNHVHDNKDAGIAMLESFNANIYDNTIENCKYGIRLSLGSGDNDIHDNTFDSSSTYGLYTYQGSDSPDVSGNDGRPKNNVFDSNTISNTKVGVKIKEGDDNTFSNNDFTGTETFEFQDSTDTTWTSNTVTGCLDGSTDFASGSIDEC